MSEIILEIDRRNGQGPSVQLSMDLVQLLYHPGSLPSIPRIVAMVLAELNQPDPDLMRINALMGQDPVLTSKLLHLANSAENHRGRAAATVNEALARLGTNQVRDLVIAAAVGASFRGVAGVPLERFWRYSLNVAKTMRHLARYRSLGPLPFTAGLLSSIGELVIARGMPEAMEHVNALTDIYALDRAQAEVKTIGYSFAHVGAGFVRHWGLGEDLATVIESQCDPLGPTSSNREPITCMLRLAAWRCRAFEAELDDQAMIATFPNDVATAMGVEYQELVELDPGTWASTAEATGIAG